MSIFLIAIGTLLLAFAYARAPKEYTAHAATQKKFARWRPMGGYSSPFVAHTDDSGRVVGTSRESVVVNIDGNSCESFGLPDGAKAIGSRVYEADVNSLKRGDLIVINRPASHESGLEVRKLDRVEGSLMYFFETNKGPLPPSNIADIWAKLEYVEDREAEPA